MRDETLARLRRSPDVEAVNLFAVDAADRLVLDEAMQRFSFGPSLRLAVVGDAFGALTLGAAAEGATAVRVVQDTVTGERALRANADRTDLMDRYLSMDTIAAAVAGAELVLLRLPRSLDVLDAQAAAIASAAPDATVVAGGRLKHMSVSMNAVLQRRYERFDVSHARQKSRVLVSSDARASQPIAPGIVSRRLDEIGLTVCAAPGAFAGARLDIGTRVLLATLDPALLPGQRFVDLGCGTGVIAAWLARARADAYVVADRVEVLRDDNASSLATASVDAIVCNPPFHSDGAVTELVAQRMIRAGARLLRPGGEMWTVFNSHLSHPAVLRSAIGETQIVARETKFTVTRSVRRSD